MDRYSHRGRAKMLEQSFVDKRCPPHALAGPNVLQYFCQPGDNPFYDRTCNNQRLLQKNQGTLNPEELKGMKGIEYVVTHSQEPVLHLIQKQNRRTEGLPENVSPMEMYYMVQGEVYQCPDMMTMLHSHMSTTLHHLEKAIALGHEMKTFHANKGYTWKQTEGEESQDLQKFKTNPYEKSRRGHSDERSLHNNIHHLIKCMHDDFPIITQTSVATSTATSTMSADTTAATTTATVSRKRGAPSSTTDLQPPTKRHEP
eukprot:m.84231 g.84231  ORF g.84231 m.84231 type:complete len:257 (-) comp25725_c0_seq2:272-1042(-)